MEYFIHLGVLLCIYLLLSQSYNLCFGMAGLLNIAHVSAYALGAYATGIMVTTHQFSAASAAAAGILLGAVFGLFMFLLSRRLSEDYFAIGTLALAGIVSALLVNWRSLTRGVLGIPGIPRLELFGFVFHNNSQFLGFAFFLVCVVLLLLRPLFFGPIARQLKAQTEFREGAMALGVNPLRAACASLMIASAVAALAGSLFAHYLSYIDPTSFSLHEMIFLLSMVVLGRPGSFYGCIAATAFLLFLPEALRFIDIPSAYLGPARQLLYGLILFLVVFWRREKLFPTRRTI